MCVCAAFRSDNIGVDWITDMHQPTGYVQGIAAAAAAAVAAADTLTTMSTRLIQHCPGTSCHGRR